MKVTAKGQIFNFKEEMFEEKTGAIVIYASNGKGKSTIKAMFKSIKETDSNLVLDLIGGIESDISALKAKIDFADEIKIFDGSESEGYKSDENKNLIIFENAQRITMLETQLLKFLKTINTSANNVKERMLALGSTPKMIGLTLYSDISAFRNISQQRGYRADEMTVEWLKMFKDDSEVRELISFIGEFIKMQSGLNFALSKRPSPNERKIALSNKNEFEQLFKAAKEYSENASLDKCPICLNDIEWDATEGEITLIIDKLMEQKEIIDFKVLFDKYKLLKMFKIEDVIKDGFPSYLLPELKRFNWKEAIINNLRETSTHFSNAEKWLSEYDELSKAVPEIEPGFKVKFESFLELTGLDKKIKTKVTKKQIILNSKNPSIPAIDVLSTGEKNLLSLGSKLSQIGKNNVIIFDDITNSNDFYNLHSILKKIDELAEKNKVIMLTHDSNFIDQIKEVEDER